MLSNEEKARLCMLFSSRISGSPSLKSIELFPVTAGGRLSAMTELSLSPGVVFSEEERKKWVHCNLVMLILIAVREIE